MRLCGPLPIARQKSADSSGRQKLHLDEAKAREQRVLFSARRIDREIREERAALKESFKRVERIHSDLSTPAITDLVEKVTEIGVDIISPII